MKRLRSESGFAVPMALSLIIIVGALSAVAVAIATHNIDRSSRDREAIRALAAADAGLDAAAYRMNKALVASRIDGLVPDGLLYLTQEVAGCLTLGAATLEVNLLGPTGCAPGAAESIDETIADDGLGASATFRYWVKLRVNVVVAGRSLIERQIVSVGQVGDTVKRVMGTYHLEVNAPVTTPFSRSSYVECSAVIPANGTDPAAGCPTS